MSTPPVQMLITGPRGCVARALIAYMRREHPEVEILRFAAFPFSMSKLWDYLTRGNVRYLVNCAGLGRDADSKEEPFTYYETNTFGVVKQLEMVRRFSPSTRYLNLGTIYEYDGYGDVLSPSVYSSSKRAAREIITTYRTTYGLHAMTATLGFTEYPGRHESFLARRITMGVARIAAAMEHGQPFAPLALHDVDQHYVWTWAEDVADGIWRMLNQEGTPRDYTLSTGDQHTVREFVDLAFATAFPGADLTNAGLMVSTGNDTAAALDRCEVRARDQLGWKPQMGFADLVTTLTRCDLDLASRAAPSSL